MKYNDNYYSNITKSQQYLGIFGAEVEVGWREYLE